jgi:WD40 repeat protein
MARHGTALWQLVAACAGIFALVFGAVVLVRVLKSSPSAASAPSVVSPHLIADVQAGRTVRSLVFSPDGNTLADELSSGVVQLRDAMTGTVTGSLGVLDARSAADRIGDGNSLAFSPDGKTLAVGVGSDVGSASKVELWNVATRRQSGQFPVIAAEVFSLAFSPDGKTLAVAAGKTLVLRTMATGTSVSIPDYGQAYQGDAWYVSFDADSRTLAVANDEGLVRLWDTVSARFTTSVTIDPAAHYTGPPEDAPSPFVEVASINADARFVAVGGGSIWTRGSQSYETPMVWLWQPGTGKYVALRNNVISREDGVESGALNPAGQLFATGDDFGEIRLWNTATHAAVAAFRSPAGTDMIGLLAFSPSGRMLASASDPKGFSGSATGSIQLWDIF